MEQLEGRVAVVTGGASGIGLALARRFGKAGMRVAVADIEEPALDHAVATLAGEGIEVVGFPTDVSDRAAVDRLRDQALERFGAVHLVCNNAGVGAGGPMRTLTTDDWAWCLGVNLWGVIHGIGAFLPLLCEQGEGHIVNTASVAGLISTPFMGPYNASKFAVVTISETLALELRMEQSPVGVSVLCPSWVATRIHESHRNRPGGPTATEADETAVMASLLGGLIAAGMDPADVADRVHDAVVAQQFYVLTHENTLPAIRARMQAILDGEPPPLVMPE